MLGFVCVVALVAVINIQQVADKKVLMQQTALNDYLFAQGYKTKVYENGFGGVFFPDKELIFVKTNVSSKETCLYFLHELGHSIQSKNGDSCFQSTDLLACEKGAIDYAQRNAFRCDGT